MEETPTVGDVPGTQATCRRCLDEAMVALNKNKYAVPLFTKARHIARLQSPQEGSSEAGCGECAHPLEHHLEGFGCTAGCVCQVLAEPPTSDPVQEAREEEAFMAVYPPHYRPSRDDLRVAFQSGKRMGQQEERDRAAAERGEAMLKTRVTWLTACINVACTSPLSNRSQIFEWTSAVFALAHGDELPAEGYYGHDDYPRLKRAIEEEVARLEAQDGA
jgi:hypothetical protein